VNFNHMETNLKNIISSLESEAKAFDLTTDSLSSQWKDARKNEFYSKHVSPYNSTLKDLISDLHSIEFKLQNITSELQNIRR